MEKGKFIGFCLLAAVMLLGVGCGGGEGITYEEAVIGGERDVRDDIVLQTMIIEEGYTREEVEELARKIAEEIKEEYPDRPVNVQAVRRGENLANIELE